LILGIEQCELWKNAYELVGMEDDYPTRISAPLLEQTSQYEQERDSTLRRLRDGRQGLLAAASSHTGLSYARTRSLLLKKNRRREDEADESWLDWPKAQLRQFSREKLPFTLPLKAGLAALIASLLCFAPGVWSLFNKNGVWAVITVDIVMETNVGLSFSKGNENMFHTAPVTLIFIGASVFRTINLWCWMYRVEQNAGYFDGIVPGLSNRYSRRLYGFV